MILTESPYEDPSQQPIAARADAAFINDPTNLDTFRESQPNTWYVPQAYDPEIHYRHQPADDFRADFGWVGTAFPSRIAFFEQVDWTGIDVKLAGNWQALDDNSPLHDFLIHEQQGCFPNEHTVELYSSVHTSANLYRKEGAAGHDQGWAMGPREVELTVQAAQTEPVDQVVVVDEFHWVKRRVKVQPMKYNATNIARMAKARSIRDSRFMA